MKNTAIQVSGLTKSFRTYQKPPGFMGAVKGIFHRTYQTTQAVKSISFTIERGEFVGFLGRNGAGKTSTLKMLSGLVYPSSGTASVLGHIPWERSNEYRRRFALVMGQKNQLWWDLPAWESLELNSKIYRIPKATFQKTAFELTEMLSVRDKLHTMVRELSLGERMKLELVASLLHRPDVLFLDEPTVGLDVLSQRIVREFLREYNRTNGTTILLTSHYMSDIEALCDRVIIVDSGLISFDGPLEDLVRTYANTRIIRFQTPPGSAYLRPSQWAHLGDWRQESEQAYSLRVPRHLTTEACRTLLDRLTVSDLCIEEVPLDDVIAAIYTGTVNNLLPIPRPDLTVASRERKLVLVPQ